MAVRVKRADVEIHEASTEEARALLDRAARYYLKMSGEAFAAAWRDGLFPNPDRPEVMRVAMLLPFGR